MTTPNDLLDSLHRKTVVKRRVIAGSIVAAVIVGCAVTAPVVVNALSYQTLTVEQAAAYDKLPEAQKKVIVATGKFQAAAEAALAARGEIRTFIAAINPKLLSDTEALDKLSKLRETLAEDAAVHAESSISDKEVVYTEYADPRLPGKTSPVTAEGLATSLDHYERVYGDLDTAATRIVELAEQLEASVDRASSLYEKVLAAAKRHASSGGVLKFTKADELVKHHFTGVVDALTDKDIDPIKRFAAFEDALGKLAKSHADTIAAEEAERKRLEAEKEAQKKAEAEAKARQQQLEEALKAANEAAERAKAEADRLAEERRKLEEAQDGADGSDHDDEAVG